MKSIAERLTPALLKRYRKNLSLEGIGPDGTDKNFFIPEHPEDAEMLHQIYHGGERSYGLKFSGDDRYELRPSKKDPRRKVYTLRYHPETHPDVPAGLSHGQARWVSLSHWDENADSAKIFEDNPTVKELAHMYDLSGEQMGHAVHDLGKDLLPHLRVGITSRMTSGQLQTEGGIYIPATAIDKRTGQNKYGIRGTHDDDGSGVHVPGSYLERRKQFEEDLGWDHHDPIQNPIYGTAVLVNPPGHDGVVGWMENTRVYGDHLHILRPETLNRTGFTAGDSLNLSYGWNAIHNASIHKQDAALIAADNRHDDFLHPHTSSIIEYPEAQVFGGVNFDHDLEKSIPLSQVMDKDETRYGNYFRTALERKLKSAGHSQVRDKPEDDDWTDEDYRGFHR